VQELVSCSVVALPWLYRHCHSWYVTGYGGYTSVWHTSESVWH